MTCEKDEFFTGEEMTELEENIYDLWCPITFFLSIPVRCQVPESQWRNEDDVEDEKELPAEK